MWGENFSITWSVKIYVVENNAKLISVYNFLNFEQFLGLFSSQKLRKEIISFVIDLFQVTNLMHTSFIL